MSGDAGNKPTAPSGSKKGPSPQFLRALEEEARRGPNLTPPDRRRGAWVPIGKPTRRKDRHPDGGSYLRWGTRDAWAWCIEHEGRVLTRMVVVRMEPEAEEALGVPPGSITAQDLRDVRLSNLDPYVRKLVSGVLSKASQKRLRQPPPRRHGRRDSDWHAAVAELYLQALQEAPRTPIAWMTDRYRTGGHQVSRATVRDWVRAARVHGFLTMGRRGSPGGTATGKLTRWRNAQEPKRRGTGSRGRKGKAGLP